MVQVHTYCLQILLEKGSDKVIFFEISNVRQLKRVFSTVLLL